MENDLLYHAMEFARMAHAGQVRKYTGNPYVDHLAEVAGIVATVDQRPETIATAWLHDIVEDTPITPEDVEREFGTAVAQGVSWLSDLERGNRAERKAMSRNRLAQAPGWVQSIKCADLISNTSSIVMHDPKFAELYLAEKRALLEVLTQADFRLREMAMSQAAGQ
jgi:guanosine-3',5'-bis(diphosphate) 3'-pyrophosphohydrolase